MARKPRTGLDAAPTRAQRAEQQDRKLDATRDDSELVMMSHKVPRHRKVYLKKLAATTGRQERDLLAEAIDLLENKYGDA